MVSFIDRSKVLVVAGLVLMGSLAPVQAHHGFGSYNEETIIVEGVVKDFFFGNPHPRVLLESEGQEWDVWLAAYPRVVYVCFAANVLSVGDTMIAIGHQSPGRFEMKTIKVGHAGKIYDFYPPDNPDRGPNADPTRVREGPCDYES